MGDSTTQRWICEERKSTRGKTKEENVVSRKKWAKTDVKKVAVEVKEAIANTSQNVRSNLIPHAHNQGRAAEMSLGGYATLETHGYCECL